MTRRILLLGKNGQVGWELQRSLAPIGQISAHDRKTCNMENMVQLAKVLDEVSPEIIINASGYTDVDKAEMDRDKAFLVNVDAPAVLANWAMRNNALLIHYSTDYVFDGLSLTPYRESDIPNPLSVYGASKLAGEQAIAASKCRYLLLRTSWVFGVRGKNFARTILRLGAEHEQLSIVSDQHGAPTSAELIADVTAQLLLRAERNHDIFGLYHLSARGETSWSEFAKYLFVHARSLGVKLMVREVKSILGAEYPSAARRPINSCLDVGKLESQFGLRMPDWRYHANRMLMEMYGD